MLMSAIFRDVFKSPILDAILILSVGTEGCDGNFDVFSVFISNVQAIALGTPIMPPIYIYIYSLSSISYKY